MINKSQLIIKKLIELYIVEKHPIGSISLAKELTLGASTIRSEMLNLDKNGFFINKGSLGRVPTDKALRYYYDNFAIENNEVTPYLKIKVIKLATSKIDTISFVPISNNRGLLTILFSNNEIINNIINLTDCSPVNLLKINEILKKTYQQKTIRDIDDTLVLKRYEKNAIFDILKTIFSFIREIENYKIDICNLEELYNVDKDLLFIVKNINIINKIIEIKDGLYFGEEHNIVEFEKYIVFKKEDVIKIFPKETNYHFLKYLEKRKEIEE